MCPQYLVGWRGAGSRGSGSKKKPPSAPRIRFLWAGAGRRRPRTKLGRKPEPPEFKRLSLVATGPLVTAPPQLGATADPDRQEL